MSVAVDDCQVYKMCSSSLAYLVSTAALEPLLGHLQLQPAAVLPKGPCQVIFTALAPCCRKVVITCSLLH